MPYWPREASQNASGAHVWVGIECIFSRRYPVNERRSVESQAWMYWFCRVKSVPVRSVASTTNPPFRLRMMNGSRRPPVPAVGVATGLPWLSGVQVRPSVLTARCREYRSATLFGDSVK
nr:hypothetical protein [Saccharothrix saharensis]